MEALPAQVSTKRILFATDFSDHSAVALPYALTLARQPGGILVVTHIVSMGPLGAGKVLHAGLAVAAQGVREAKTLMDQLEARLTDVDHHCVVRSGNVRGEIGALVEDERIDVMVVGTHGRTGMGKAVFGSVAEELFRHARCPVLTVGPQVRAAPEGVAELHSILYPTDFSKESQAALAYAISLARERGARLYLLHVTSPGADSDRHLLEAQLRALVPEQARLGCEPKALVQAGQPAPVILEAANELAVDLIVMGPKSHLAIPGAMATTYRVVTQASCPVLTVRG
jgi:nucleotide-binding universal stress UspA family protein